MKFYRQNYRNPLEIHRTPTGTLTRRGGGGQQSGPLSALGLLKSYQMLSKLYQHFEMLRKRFKKQRQTISRPFWGSTFSEIPFFILSRLGPGNFGAKIAKPNFIF